MDDTKFTGPEDVQAFLESEAFVQGFKEWLVSSPLFQEIVECLEELVERETPRIRKFMETAAPLLSPVLSDIEKWNISMDVLAKAGWLPHYTMPFAAIAKSDGNEDQVCAAILEYYTRNWENVREQIENRLTGYRIDAEAKATLREAFDAHESGLHRCVCRVLFPEIERVLFVKLFGGILGDKRITYDKYIKTLAGEDRSIEDFIVDGLYDLAVFGQITKAVREKDRQDHGEEHLSKADEMIFGIFSSVRNEGHRESLSQNPIPNRHAAMHGVVSYSLPQHSLNTIFLADYMFGIVSRIFPSGVG